MSDYLKGKAVRTLTKGIRVSTSAGLDTGNTELFEIVGGHVIVHQILGVVTTATEAENATTKLVSVPDSGAGAADICDTLVINDHAVGMMYGITGTPGDNMVSSRQVLVGQASEQILPPGDITLNQADASRSGQIRWEVFYTPVEDGAYIGVA